ncbi:MAG: Gfo/Idh/MocA family oxidoreductase [Methanophagales archaeon]|nr:Gfo/Idh/MocA family oxidoreductase [Methanophagales archaeon]
MGKLRIGVVGCGGVANEIHIPIWRKIDNAEIVAVCDKNKEVAKETRDKFNIDVYFTKLSEMLDNTPIDIVDNCTPVQLHASVSIQAMEAGCHTLVEKPMAVNLEEANEMINTAKRNGVKLGVIHNTLFNLVVMKAKSIIEKGGIGNIIGMDVKYLKRRDDSWVTNKNHWSHKLPGGIFGEILAHPIYLERAFLGNLDPIFVYTRKFSDFDWIKSDELRVILAGEKGIGTIALSLNAPRNEALIDIYGTKMNLHLELWTAIMIKYKPTSVASFPTKRDSFSLGTDSLNRGFQEISGTFSNASKLIFGKIHSGHHSIIRTFVEYIQNNKKPLVTAEDGREVVRVIEKICNEIQQ